MYPHLQPYAVNASNRYSALRDRSCIPILSLSQSIPRTDTQPCAIHHVSRSSALRSQCYKPILSHMQSMPLVYTYPYAVSASNRYSAVRSESIPSRTRTRRRCTRAASRCQTGWLRSWSASSGVRRRRCALLCSDTGCPCGTRVRPCSLTARQSCFQFKNKPYKYTVVLI